MPENKDNNICAFCGDWNRNCSCHPDKIQLQMKSNKKVIPKETARKSFRPAVSHNMIRRSTPKGARR